MQLTIIVLRLIHIVCGALWVGAAVFIALFIEPAARALGVAGGQLMAELGRRKFHIWMMIMAIFAILSGIVLFGIDSQWFTNQFTKSRWSTGLQIGAGLAIIAMIYGMTVSRPTVVKLGEKMPKMAQMPPGPDRDALAKECEALSHRLTFAGRAVAVLLALALAFMAVARYL